MKITHKYKPIINPLETIDLVHEIITFFEKGLSESLQLKKVNAPVIVESGKGINDDSDGSACLVKFKAESFQYELEMVRSLAKWKRPFLAKYKFKAGSGIFANSLGIRPDEKISAIHSIQVEQWDWELVISSSQKNQGFLFETVQKIYTEIQKTEQFLSTKIPLLKAQLPPQITFIHAEKLLADYWEYPQKERENEVAKKYGAVFIQGIGGKLKNGKPHGKRAADYDDWSTLTEKNVAGLNGDIIFWSPALNASIEICSMGIRVDENTLKHQLEITGNTERLELEWHKNLLQGNFPQTIGGGIGISRLCMFLLQKAHIGEVQQSAWPKEIINFYKKNNIHFL